jgi:hypothetical protein
MVNASAMNEAFERRLFYVGLRIRRPSVFITTHKKGVSFFQMVRFWA